MSHLCKYTHAVSLEKLLFDMHSVPESINALRIALHEKGVESHILDAFNHLASCLVLLVCVRELL